MGNQNRVRHEATRALVAIHERLNVRNQQKRQQSLLVRIRLAVDEPAHLVDRLALPELVTFAERQEFDSPAVRAYLQRELAPYPLEAYSAIVLGCTHFNYFKAALREVVPPSVRFVDGNEGTVNELVRRLRERGELAQAGTSATTYYYSGRRVTAPQELARIERYLRQLDRVYAL